MKDKKMKCNMNEIVMMIDEDATFYLFIYLFFIF
jgi:hypothetical protein